MKRFLNLAPKKAWKYIAVCLLAGITKVNAQQTNPIYTVYNNETEIKGIQSVTLKDGFHIPAGKTVRIFTGASFKECVPFLSSLSADQNYVSTKIFKMPRVSIFNIDSARSTCEVNQTVQYFDGLGRPLQTVVTQGSPSFKDVVQPVAYDAFGREQVKYLPYTTVTGANGSFRPSAVTAQTAFYNTPPSGVTTITGTAFSETLFEASPLNRVLEQGAPGTSWKLSGGHTQRIAYETNILNEVKLWNITSNGATSSGVYLPGTLSKTVTKDENWKNGDGKSGTIEEFKDLQGRVVLKRAFNTGEMAHSTYYVYDDLDNLRYVLPPAVNDSAPDALSSFAEIDAVFNQFIYAYRYDGRKRVIKKKIPGKGWEDMVYNKLDQLVLSRDAEQRDKGKWVFNKYDALGRAVITGLLSSTADQVTWQPLIDAQSTLWEIRNNDNASGTGTGYSNASLPNTGIDTYLTISYYDDYDFFGNSFPPPNGTTQMLAARTKGLQTGSFVYQLGSSTTRYLSVNYYDDEGRVIKTSADNHLGGKDHTDNTWNFAGELTASTRTHTGASGPATTIATRYDYDHMGRKLATMQSINGQLEVVLSKLAYNEVGQLLKKELHSKDNGSSFLQKTDYTYNERGWLKNNISNQFSFKLDYEDGLGQGYNGNITKQHWDWIYTLNPTAHSFNYGYDRLNRLTSGVNTSLNMSEQLTYDMMGNIASMNRDGAGISTYSYSGNRLNKVATGPLTTLDYEYDLNGNAKFDGRNGVTIGYNILNLPSTLGKSGLSMSYTYDATGNKLKKVSSSEAISDYVDGIQYTGGAIDFIMTEEGKARNNGGTYVYEYNLTDHLGNVRYTFNQHPTTGVLQGLQTNNYYPFGKQVGGTGVNKYLYNGKELQNELGQLDYGARFYDPEIGRWNVVDPLAEKFSSSTTYNYVDNNPIRKIDPNGMEGNDWYESEKTGTLKWFEGNGHQEGYKHKGASGKVISRGDRAGVVNLNADGTATNAETGELATQSVSGKTRIVGKDSGQFETLNSVNDFITGGTVTRAREALITYNREGAQSYFQHMMANAHMDEFYAFSSAFRDFGVRSTNNGVVYMNPKDIHFMQDNIRNVTGEFTVLGNAEALRSGALNSNVLKMNVWKDQSGRIWTLDHRRLAAFRLSGLNEAPVQFSSPAGQMWKMRTKTEGKSIKLKLGNGKSMIVE